MDGTWFAMGRRLCFIDGTWTVFWSIRPRLFFNEWGLAVFNEWDLDYLLVDGTWTVPCMRCTSKTVSREYKEETVCWMSEDVDRKKHDGR